MAATREARTSTRYSAISSRSRPAYRDRDARLALMDEQGMAGASCCRPWASGWSRRSCHDLDAVVVTFRAFNRWMEEDWGFAYKERIFAAPYITLCRARQRRQELEWALERDARFIVMVPGPISTDVGMRAPGDPMFDDFWRLANDSGITVCYHSGETYYSKFMPAWGEPDYMMSFQALLGFRSLFSGDALQDTFANHLHCGLFHRFPNLRMASIESGSAWVFHLFEKLSKSYGQIPQIYKEDPRETFRRHVWVSPFYEDELASLLKLVGEDRIIMGSDYPHVEGLADPASLHQGSGELRLHPRAVPNRHARQRSRTVRPPAGVRRRMKVAKAGIVAMLLEVGEENAAVLLARSQLPDELDTERDLEPLLAFGLDRDQVDEVARLTIGAIETDDVNTRRRRDDLEKTISRRWAGLVDDWVS